MYIKETTDASICTSLRSNATEALMNKFKNRDVTFVNSSSKCEMY